MEEQYKYMIAVMTFGAAKKYNAILEALVNTAQYVRNDNNKPIIFGDKSTAQYMLSRVYDVLKDTTYTRRNTRTRLESGYRIVYMTDGEDCEKNPDGSFDAIDVRGIQSDKVLLQFSIQKLD